MSESFRHYLDEEMDALRKIAKCPITDLAISGMKHMISEVIDFDGILTRIIRAEKFTEDVSNFFVIPIVRL